MSTHIDIIIDVKYLLYNAQKSFQTTQDEGIIRYIRKLESIYRFHMQMLKEEQEQPRTNFRKQQLRILPRHTVTDDDFAMPLPQNW